MSERGDVLRCPTSSVLRMNIKPPDGEGKVPLCLCILPSKHVDNVIVGLREFLRFDIRVHWPASQADSVNIHCQSFCIAGKTVARGWP